MTPIEAARPIVNFAGELVALGLHSAMLWVYEFNPAAIRCYEKVGFRDCGRRRESRWFNDRSRTKSPWTS
jgi:RimJ/RimL family protein N-acetyltransferase